ncbi:MAG: alpha/beta fold hydrolase [Gammaproteobacteria bacterium]|nr:alpha/beta fold hydrolase [Gammaproteobacteria bacterium]
MRCSLLFSILSVCFAAGAVTAAETSSSRLSLEPCTLTGSFGVGQVEARCGTLIVAENPEDADGPTLELFVAVIRSLSANPKPDALTLINGGPGGSSVQLYVDMYRVFSGFLIERDILLVDQRGTGRSNPLDCADLEQASEETDLDVLKAATRSCLKSLNGDPRFYSTSVAVQDLELVRLALGYEQLNVYGVSYGTRVALHYLRRYPDSVRTLIIDGVVPPSLVLGANIAINSQQTLDGIFARCKREPACAESFPDLEANFASLSSQLKANPIELNVPHPVTGEATSLTLSYGHLAITIRLLAYSPETTALIPLIIEEAATRRNYVPIATHALKVISQISSAINFGMHNSVVCTEDTPFFNYGEAVLTELDKTYLGSEQVEVLNVMCDEWPEGLIDSDMKEPLQADHPILILSGENDPITPPRYGDQVLVNFADAQHLIAPGQGHGVISRGCLPRLVTEFVESADVAAIDSSCVERMAATPFFINLMGPAP